MDGVEARLAHAIIHDRGQQDDAVQRHAAIFQLIGERARSGGAIAFAENIFGVAPAAILCGVAQDRLGKGVDILVDAIEVGALGIAQRPRIARSYRVQEHHVGAADQAVGIGADIEGRGRDRFRIAGADMVGRKAAHAQPQRGRTGTAIVEEGQRAMLTGRGIGGVEDAGGRLALGVADGQRAGGRGVGDRLAVDAGRALAGLGHFLDRGAGPVLGDLVRRLLGMLLGRVGRAVLLGKGRVGQGKGEEGSKAKGGGQPHGVSFSFQGANLTRCHRRLPQRGKGNIIT